MSPPSVFLIGFMATGKTTVGRRLAEVMGRPFIDLDAAIEAVAGRTVRDIFAVEGEAGFRAREREALVRVVEGIPAVVATGGGTPCFAESLALMRRRGVVVALTAPLEEVARRVLDPSSRPLLLGPAGKIRALYEQRASIYRQAHFGVRTEERSVDAVVEEIAGALGAAFGLLGTDPVVVPLGERSYPVVIAAGVLDQLGELARARFGERCRAVGLISDSNVDPLYGPRCQAELEGHGFAVRRVTVPAGEETKSLAELGRVAEALVGAELDRTSALVALGGGVVGDLTGTAAALLFRGVPWAQVATTTVAMIDSAIGGKTGVNLSAGKNLLGAFWQPRFVLGDCDALATLPERERRAAAGELVKYGLLDGEETLRELEAVLPAHSSGAAPAGDLIPLIRRCAALKAWIVSRDEREQTGERALLNLGHTVGHALEAAGGYGVLLHGEAVALGLIASCRVSAWLGMCDAALERRVAALLASAGLDVDLDARLDAEVVARLAADKKRAGDAIRFVALRAPGSPEIATVSVDELGTFLLTKRSV